MSYTGRFQRYTVPLWSFSSASDGTRPSSRATAGSSPSTTGRRAGKYRTFSSNRSNTEVIHRSPNHTRGRTPCAFSSSLRVSVACSNSGMRVSRQSSLPRRYGEFADTASCTPAITCEAFQYAAKSSGEVCTWNCVLVHAASGMIESAVVRSFSAPVIDSAMSSPRASRICSLRSA